VNGSLFEVVAVDEDDATIELQHFDGTIDEVDLDGWVDLHAEPAEAPEDWSGSVDIDLEDLPDPESSLGRGRQDPMEFVDNYE